MAYLMVVDRGYRGSVEAQFFDALYGVLMLGDQLGGVEVVLRGNAVTAAVADEEPLPAFRVGSVDLPAPRQTVCALVAKGVPVHVDRPDLTAFGLDDGALIDGVTCSDTAMLAARWTDYDGVWFL
ncbi:DsrE family protein [Amycolatopsis panacis]|uniref:DsrE family protein n=1 Tax=Amycolatopsis panacis TaxID=2340917 RepID=A0A419HJ79_9PSEU|nr:DsrE family protein [Amycolatopsis panacis]RJQ75852.1 hypothetical protein D5S19_30985 [Amycolatopsis panacis]